MKTTLEIIGAAVMTIFILGTPVLSFVSFAHDWNGLLEMFFMVGSAVDFIYVLSKLMEEIEK